MRAETPPVFYNIRCTGRLRRLALGMLPLALLALTGCPPRKAVPVEGPPPPARPLAEQVATVNANIAGITHTLSGGGINVTARIHDEGKEHRYDLDGKIRFLPPRFLYFDLSHFGVAGSIMRIGSNDQEFWAWVKPEQNKLWYGRWADLHPADTGNIPLSPDMILAAMGLSPLPSPDMALAGPEARVDSRYYKLRYYAGGQHGLWLEREYWLDRYPPFLPRVVVFYKPDHRILMRATLDDYRPVDDSTVYVARDIQMTWPKDRDSLRVRFGKLKFDPSITARSAAFFSPQRNPRLVPIPPDRWTRVTEEGEVDEEFQPASMPAPHAPASAPSTNMVPATPAFEAAPAPQSAPSTEPAIVIEPPATAASQPASALPKAPSSAPVSSEPSSTPSTQPPRPPLDAQNSGPRTQDSGLSSRPAGLASFQPGVTIDWSNKQVLLAGEIVLREGDLELLACSPQTKEHESIIRVRCRPLHVFQALRLIGLEPGHPPFYNNATKSVVAATGQPVAVSVRWSADGQVHTAPAWQWLWNKQENKPADPIDWVFAGSMATKDDQLLADYDGTVITVVDFESSLISVPASHTSSNPELWLTACTEKIPPVGTPVTVILEAAGTPLVFRLDRLGGLDLNGRPCTLREAMEAARGAGQGPSRQVSPAHDHPGTEAPGSRAVVDYDAEVPEIQVSQLVAALHQAGLSDVAVRSPRAPASSPATASKPAADAGTPTSFEQGLKALQTLSDLGKQLPSSIDILANSVKDKYQRLSDRAAAAGNAAAGAAKAFEVMQGSPPAPPPP